MGLFSCIAVTMKRMRGLTTSKPTSRDTGGNERRQGSGDNASSDAMSVTSSLEGRSIIARISVVRSKNSSSGTARSVNDHLGFAPHERDGVVTNLAPSTSNSTAMQALSLVCGSGFIKVEELQCVSVAHCNVAREANIKWLLTINRSTPGRVLRLIQPRNGTRQNARQRIPLPKSIQHLRYDLNEPIQNVCWPENLLQLSFGGEFDQRVEALRGAPRLEHLWLGQKFNQPIEHVNWPQSLRQLRFGNTFNQPVERVSWPEGLQQLVFGCAFNQPIAGIKAWPLSLRLLAFGADFNQSMQGVSLPPLLEFLEFRDKFNQPFTDLHLPESLRHLRFSLHFNQSLHGVAWPVSLRHVWLCGRFDQPVSGIDWPPGLRALALPRCYKSQEDEEQMVLPFGCRLCFVSCG